jgi:hypothetical protein
MTRVPRRRRRRRQDISMNMYSIRTTRRSSLLSAYYSCCCILVFGIVQAAATSTEQQQQQQQQQKQQQKHIPMYGGAHNSNYNYNYNDESDIHYATLSDIWLCLACALGWSVWLVSTRAQSQEEAALSEFDIQDSQRVMGHVLQVSLGEDADGTGIPVYHALVDYVVGVIDNEPLQVRKCFNTHKLLEEGFANVEVLVLTDDPTTSILLDDYLQDKTEQLQPPSMIWIVGMYILALSLIGASLVGGIHVLNRLEPSQHTYGWVSIGVGIVFLYPAAVLLYHCGMGCYHRWSERPGVIIHGTRAALSRTRHALSRQCGALNPLQAVFGDPLQSFFSQDHQPQPNESRPPSVELVAPNSQMTAMSPLYPNAGCGFGNFNVHMQEPTSSVSSISSERTRSVRTHNSLFLPQLDNSILEQYEQAVKLETKHEQNNSEKKNTPETKQ